MAITMLSNLFAFLLHFTIKICKITALILQLFGHILNIVVAAINLKIEMREQAHFFDNKFGRKCMGMTDTVKT